MRDLFRSGSAAQFLVHGNVFDVVPGNGRLLSVPQFLDEVMFATYDVVLRYDRSRGARATRGSADWSEWLTNALGPDGATMTLLREPGSALEIIDRYLLRTLNLQAIGGASGKAPRRIAVIIEFAEFVVPRGDALQLGGPFAANVVKVLGWANDPAIAQANIVTVLVSEGLHDLNALVVENPHAAALHVPLPDEDGMRDVRQDAGRDRVPDARGGVGRAARRVGHAADRSQPRRRAHGDRAGAQERQADHDGVARRHQERDDRARMPGAARVHRVAVHARQRRRARRGEGLAARRHDAACAAARCTRCRWGT